MMRAHIFTALTADTFRYMTHKKAVAGLGLDFSYRDWTSVTETEWVSRPCFGCESLGKRRSNRSPFQSIFQGTAKPSPVGNLFLATKTGPLRPVAYGHLCPDHCPLPLSTLVQSVQSSPLLYSPLLLETGDLL
jgi:hypothetical protein